MWALCSPNPRVECSTGRWDSGLRVLDQLPARALRNGAIDVLSVVLQVRLLILSESAHVVMNV